MWVNSRDCGLYSIEYLKLFTYNVVSYEESIVINLIVKIDKVVRMKRRYVAQNKIIGAIILAFPQETNHLLNFLVQSHSRRHIHNNKLTLFAGQRIDHSILNQLITHLLPTLIPQVILYLTKYAYSEDILHVTVFVVDKIEVKDVV